MLKAEIEDEGHSLIGRNVISCGRKGDRFYPCYSLKKHTEHMQWYGWKIKIDDMKEGSFIAIFCKSEGLYWSYLFSVKENRRPDCLCPDLGITGSMYTKLQGVLSFSPRKGHN